MWRFDIKMWRFATFIAKDIIIPQISLTFPYVYIFLQFLRTFLFCIRCPQWALPSPVLVLLYFRIFFRFSWILRSGGGIVLVGPLLRSYYPGLYLLRYLLLPLHTREIQQSWFTLRLGQYAYHFSVLAMAQSRKTGNYLVFSLFY